MSEEYDKIHIRVANYLAENFQVSMGDAVNYAESITNIVKDEVEPTIEEVE